MITRWTKSGLTWLERRWLAPAYGGGVLLGLTVSFLGSAVNTMSGWLYAMSGMMLAIALVSLWLPPRNLQGIEVHRAPVRPVSVGESLSFALTLNNTSSRAKALLQVLDPLPERLGATPEKAITTIPAGGQRHWHYTCFPTRRGVYRWSGVVLRTAAPLGLFWCQRFKSAPAHAIVYPEDLFLKRCPLIDDLRASAGLRQQAPQQTQLASDGLTRSLRPYRWGDPTRLIHWRTSARYGELRVRELEQLTADNQVLLGLDTSDRWSEVDFEAAVTTIASLYRYGLRRQLSVAVWLPHTGLLHHQHAVLAALAEVMPAPPTSSHRLPNQAMVWFSSSRQPPPLPLGSVWVCWQTAAAQSLGAASLPVYSVSAAQPLADQLQSTLRT